MMDFLTPRRIGILVVIAGTVLLALSVRVKGQYNSGSAAKVARRASREGKVIPTETRIDRLLFWSGLFLIALGSLLQW